MGGNKLPVNRGVQGEARELAGRGLLERRFRHRSVDRLTGHYR